MPFPQVALSVAHSLCEIYAPSDDGRPWNDFSQGILPLPQAKVPCVLSSTAATRIQKTIRSSGDSPSPTEGARRRPLKERPLLCGHVGKEPPLPMPQRLKLLKRLPDRVCAGADQAKDFACGEEPLGHRPAPLKRLV